MSPSGCIEGLIMIWEEEASMGWSVRVGVGWIKGGEGGYKKEWEVCSSGEFQL